MRLKGFAALVIAAGFACQANAGVLYAWGSNQTGQLGDGTTINRNSPTLVPGLPQVHSATAGLTHSLALLPDGTVRSWGSNGTGQLGDGTNISHFSAAPVVGLDNVVSVAGGGAGASAGWSLALRSDGTVYAWGFNLSGQLGDGTTASRSSPGPVTNLSNVRQVSAGNGYGLALLTDGTVRSWGANTSGTLGNGTTSTSQSVPVTTSGLSNVVSVAAGNGHSLAVMSDGSVQAWGGNANRELGVDTITIRTTPGVVPGLSNVRSVSAGSFHSLAALNDGTVMAWGGNLSGQLGDGSTANRFTPQIVIGLSNIVEVEATSSSSYALSADGRLWAWGANGFGQLGIGNTTSKLLPTEVLAPAGFRFDSISAGVMSNHMLALLSPIPAPSTAALLSLAGLVAVHRKRH